MFYRNEYTKCGKPNCKKCPHGPYWYAYWREGKRLRKKYIGKTKPEQEADDRQPEQEETVPYNPKYKRIFHKYARSLSLSCEILGLSPNASEEEATKHFRTLCLLHHPDRGGSHEMMALLNSAWDYYKERRFS